MFRVAKPSLFVLIAVVLVLGAVFLLRTGPLRGVPMDAPAPDFSLQAPNRGPVTLDSFDGDVVLLTFGRPSCAPECTPQLTALADAMERLGDRRAGVRVLFVTLEPDRMGEQELLAFVQDHDLGFTGLRSDSSAVFDARGAYRALEDAVPDSVWDAAAAGPGSRTDTGAGPRVYGIDGNGVLRVVWGAADADAIARDTRRLLRY